MPIGANLLPPSRKEAEKEQRRLDRLGPALYWTWQATKAVSLMVGGVLGCLMAGAALLVGIYGSAEILMMLGVRF